jgi:hypothetical protein
MTLDDKFDLGFGSISAAVGQTSPTGRDLPTITEPYRSLAEPM